MFIPVDDMESYLATHCQPPGLNIANVNPFGLTFRMQKLAWQATSVIQNILSLGDLLRFIFAPPLTHIVAHMTHTVSLSYNL